MNHNYIMYANMYLDVFHLWVSLKMAMMIMGFQGLHGLAFTAAMVMLFEAPGPVFVFFYFYFWCLVFFKNLCWFIYYEFLIIFFSCISL